MAKAYITSGTTFSVATDGSNITVECIGGGGGGHDGNSNIGTGGGGGAYALKTVAYVSSTSITVAIGAGGVGGTSPTDGGDTDWNSGVVIAKGGQAGQSAAGGAGGAAASCTPSTGAFSGGAGGGLGSNSRAGAGGGGAAGPNGNASAGGVGGAGSPYNGAGGGGNGGGSTTAGGASTTVDPSGAGGTAQDGTAGGAGVSTDGQAGNPGSNGSGGSGSAGQGAAVGAGGAGGNGNDFDATHGSGGGGGGGGGNNGGPNGGTGGNGGLYGGGAGGGGFPSGVGGNGGQGLIVVTYTPPSVITLTPGAGSIALTGGTPAAALNFTLTPGAGSIALTGGTPVVTALISLAPGAGTIILSPGKPGVSTVRTTGTGNQLWIGSTQFYWHESTFKIVKQLSGNWSAEFDLDFQGGSKPAVGQEVAMFWDSVKRFGGLVQSIKEVGQQGRATYSKLHVKVGGFQLYTDRVIIAKLFTLLLGGTSGITIYEIWKDKLLQFGITKSGDSPANAIGEQLFLYITVTEAFNRIKAQDPGYDWWIDDNKLLHYESTNPAGAANAPFTIRDGDTNTDEMSVTTSDVRFRNRQWVLPSAELVSFRNDTTVQSVAGNLVFESVYIINLTPIVKLDGVDQIVTPLGTWPAGWQFYYIPGGIGVYARTAPTVGQTVQIRYRNPFPLAFSAEDAASIASVGLYEAVWQAKNVYDQTTAEDEAAGLLELYGAAGYPKEVEFTYNSFSQAAWLTPGMIIDIIKTLPVASGKFTVEQVTSQEFGLKVWKHTVVCRAGLGEVTDAQALEQFRISARTVVKATIIPVTLELDINGVGVQVGTLPNTFVVENKCTLTSWDILMKDFPPTGADIIIDARRSGSSFFASSVDMIRARAGVATLQSGGTFVSDNIVLNVGDVITFNIVQVGSTFPGRYGVVHFNGSV